MAQPAYRKASDQTGLLLIAFAATAGTIATPLLLIHTGAVERFGNWVVLICAVPLLAALIFGFRIYRRAKRNRIGLIVARLEASGLRVLPKPGLAQQEEFAAPLAHLLPTLGLAQTGAAGIEWLCAHGTGAATMRIFEHEFITGSGRTTNIHTHTVAAWPAGHPEIGDPALATAPWVMAARTSWLLRRVSRAQESRHPAFADLANHWAIRGDDATGQRFLTPAVRAQLTQSGHGEAWSIGAGWVCCSSNGLFTAEQLERFLAHARSVLAATRR
jgi:hypothetical protein